MGIIDRISKKGAKAETSEKKVAAPKKATTKKVKAEVKTEAVVASTPVTSKTAHEIIVRPVVTEKAALAQSVSNKYTFIVTNTAKKNQVKVAIKELYNVDVLKVNMVNVEGQRIRFGRNAGRKADFKKAIVTLPAGKTITIHEGV